MVFMAEHQKRESGAVSLPGILAGMCGLAFLYAFVKYPALAGRQNRWMQIIFIAASAAMAGWGIFQVFRGPRISQDPAKTRKSTSIHRISWLGVVLILVGFELTYATVTRMSNPLYLVVGVLLGGLLILIGIREIIRAMLPVSDDNRPRNRQALPLQGAVFLVMMSVMFVGSLVGRSNMLMLVFALMAGPFIASGWTTFTMLKRTHVRRRLPSRIMAGDRMEVEVTLENGKRWLSSWLLDVTDRISGNDETLTAGILFNRVPPQSQQTGRYEVCFMQRGRYRFSPMLVTTRFPLGFVERGLEFPLTDEVLVYPRLGKMLPAWRREKMTDTELVQRQHSHAGIYDDEFHRLREYRWGDNPRAIHWRTSARRNELMVREFHQTREQDLTLLLDLWIPEHPSEEDWERVERAISFAATAGVEHMQESRDSKITLLLAGQTESRWEGHAGPAGFDSFLESLALIQPALNPNRNWLWETASNISSPANRIVLITTRETNDSEFPKPGVENSHKSRQNELPEISTRFLQILKADEATLSPYFQLLT
ncbi:MAG: hypothetical protein Tsb009_16670 [Planctomycetaceae bacterium]